MVFSRNRCEKCLEYMRVDKKGSDYVLVCPNCEREKDEENWE